MLSPLGVPVLPQKGTSWLAEPKEARTGIGRRDKSLFRWSRVMMVTDEERALQNLDHTLLPPVPPPELFACVSPIRSPVEMVLFLPSTFGFIPGLSG